MAEESQKALFGDVFQTKADYTKGTYYQATRRYLHDGPNHLQPPSEFKTKKQVRNELRKDNNFSLQKLSFPKKEIDGGEMLFAGMKAQMKKQEGTNKKQQRKQPVMVYVETYSSTDKADWDEQFQAGCKIWINHKTGEVSSECPWIGCESKEISSGNETVQAKTEDIDGTGSLVYDSSEFAQLLDLLDSDGKKK